MNATPGFRLVFFSSLTWEEQEATGWRKTQGRMAQELMRRPEVRSFLFVESQRRWLFRVDERKVNGRTTIFGLPVGLPFERFGPIRRLNRSWQGEAVARAVRRCGAMPMPTVCWFYDWQPAEVVRHVPRDLAVMEVTDSLEGCALSAGGSLTAAASARRAGLEVADVILTVADGLRDEISPGPRTVECLPNAIDEDFLNQAAVAHPRPQLLAGVENPILLVVGTGWSLNYRLDHDLLQQVLNLLPGWALVIVGVEYVKDPGLARLLARPGVKKVGLVPRMELVGYIQSASVCSIPYRPENSPRRDALKLYEYIACGRPVVAGVESFRPELAAFVRSGRSPAEFASACEEFLRMDPRAWLSQARPILRGMTWSRRADLALALCQEVLARKTAETALPAAGSRAR